MTLIVGPDSTGPQRPRASGSENLLYSFEAYVLDTGTRELKRGTELIAVEPQVFDLLVYLIENRDRVVSKDDLIASVWQGRIVSESTLTSRINAARKAIGDSGEQQTLIRTVIRKGLRFVGSVQQDQERPEATSRLPAIARKQEISFSRSADGVNIAFAAVGNGPTLIKTANWLTHLEYDWESPVWSPLLQRFAEKNRLIRYDGRGNGLSDRDANEISFSGFVRDFESVIESMKLARFAILGISQGAAIAIDYAVRQPERVSKLVLHGAYAQGRNKRGSAEEIEKAQTFLSMMRHGWGHEHSAFMRAFASVFIPNGSSEQIKWFADLQRITTTAANAARIRTACDDIDITELLPKVRVPTLVTHSRHDNVVPLEQGRLLAAAIPNARFVTLESDNHVPLAGEPAWEKFMGEIEAFLAS
jgi:DNA-binding winged helix-turn-helix (wHTH) protein/alpha-beta hydrolase superfamily lysophospholipase